MKNLLNHNEEEFVSYPSFYCLAGKDVIRALVSDHHPIAHNGVLFWNVMMQGRRRQTQTGTSYNNGFGLVEDEAIYVRRLKKVAQVLAEMVERYPQIEAICLCEGPVQMLHEKILLDALKSFTVMEKFFNVMTPEQTSFHQPNQEGYAKWGLLMLAEQHYKVSAIATDFIPEDIQSKLANRFQLWQLEKAGTLKYISLAHFPFSGDETASEKKQLSVTGIKYCEMIQRLFFSYQDLELTFCADFNLNPCLISQWEDRMADHIPQGNSMLITEEKNNHFKQKQVTVDGILFSDYGKRKWQSQRFNPTLFSSLIREQELLQTHFKKKVQENRLIKK